MTQSNIEVWQVGDYEWVVGADLNRTRAVEAASSATGCSVDEYAEYDDTDIHPLSESAMQKLRYSEDETVENSISFSELFKNLIESGYDGTPQIFAVGE